MTKYLVAVSTKDSTAVTAANCLLEHVICKLNFPSVLVSDNATSFTSKVIEELTNSFAIKKVFSTRYNAKENICERQNKSINHFMRRYANSGPKKRNWGEMLKFATFVYNNTVHSTTNFSPHSLTFGFSIRHICQKKKQYTTIQTQWTQFAII